MHRRNFLVRLGQLSAYGTDAYFWGGGVFARATGLKDGGATNLLVRVDDLGRLVAFLRSDAVKSLGKVRSSGNTLGVNFQGTAYTVTNADPADFGRAVSGGGVAAPTPPCSPPRSCSTIRPPTPSATRTSRSAPGSSNWPRSRPAVSRRASRPCPTAGLVQTPGFVMR